MKILICTAIGKRDDGRYINLFPSRWSWTQKFHTSTYYPYDLAYLSSLLKAHLPQHEIRLLDGNYQGYTINKYAEVLIEERADVIVMEADSLTYLADMEVLRRVKQACGTRIVMCGPFPTSYPERSITDGADFVALGEFQVAVLGLIESNFASNVPGIFPNGRAPLVDINTLPWPENDDIKRRHYGRIWGCEYREVELFPTRGCPVNCNYCVVRNIYYDSAKFRVRDVQDVIAEMQYMKHDTPELEGFFFNEESHAANPNYIIELCDAIRRSDVREWVHIEAMLNYYSLNRGMIERMVDAGYYKVRFGIETLDAENSDKIFSSRWKKDNEKLYQVLEDCKGAGMKVYATLSVGTYGSSAETDRRTLESLKHLYAGGYIQDWQVSINTPMPGTPFYNEVVEKGYLAIDDPARQDGMGTSVVDYPGYRREEIEAVFREFQDFGRTMVFGNQDRGIRYSMYDRVWTKHCLDVTPISETYT